MQEIMTTIKTWQQDPVIFVTKILQAQPQEWQKKVLQSLTTKDKIAIRSGHGVGKTALIAWIILWWILSFYPAKVACTAPTGHQLKDILWAEIGKWLQKLPASLQASLSLSAEKLELIGGDNIALARTARRDQPEAFQGFHSDHMLFIIDEASGVDEVIFEAGQGALSGKGAKVIMTGNPTRLSGTFFEAFHRQREFWACFHVPASESAQVDPKFIAEMAAKYGASSNIFRVRVAGDFPSHADDAVIPLEWVESAVHRDVDILPKSQVVWGLDVARFGDDRSALARRQGNHLLAPIQSWQGKDMMQVAGIIKQLYDEAPDNQRPSTIAVDVIGLGAGVADRLRELGLPVHDVNVAESAAISERYHRLRDELWFKAREWFEARNVCLPDDSGLIAELASLSYDIDSNGKIHVQSKSDLKKKGLGSPDLADSFILTFVRGGEPVWKRELAYEDRWIV